jgi:Uma2 family endonuclease
MALPQYDPYMTESEYLAFERESDIRHEYVDGEIYAMSGGSWNHSVIISNTNRSLGNQLEGQPCISISSEMRLHVASAKAYRYPDVMVVCGEPLIREDRTDIITNPIVLIEVLSPSTASIDHIEKKYEYFQIPTVNEYLIVSQDKPQIERYLRQNDDTLLNDMVSGLDAMIELSSINCTLEPSDVYQQFKIQKLNDKKVEIC